MIVGYRYLNGLKMKAGRTEKILKRRIKSHRQIILGESFGTDSGRVKPFSEDDRGEDRRFETSLPGFGHEEEKHVASRYLSKTLARITLSSRGRVTIPREMRTRLGIKPGQMVSITAVDGQFTSSRYGNRESRSEAVCPG